MAEWIEIMVTKSVTSAKPSPLAMAEWIEILKGEFNMEIALGLR